MTNPSLIRPVEAVVVFGPRGVPLFQVAERVSSVSIAPRESLCLVVDGKQTRRVGRFNRPQQHKFTGQYGFGGDVRLQSRAGLARAETRPRTLTATAHERGRD